MVINILLECCFVYLIFNYGDVEFLFCVGKKINFDFELKMCCLMGDICNVSLVFMFLVWWLGEGVDCIMNL